MSNITRIPQPTPNLPESQAQKSITTAYYVISRVFWPDMSMDLASVRTPWGVTSLLAPQGESDESIIARMRK